MRVTIVTRIFAAFLVVGLAPLGVSVFALGRSRAASTRLAAMRDGLVPVIQVASAVTAFVSSNKDVLDRVVEDGKPPLRAMAGATFLEYMQNALDQGRRAIERAGGLAGGGAMPGIVELTLQIDKLGKLLEQYRDGAGALEAAFEAKDGELARTTRETLLRYNHELAGETRVLFNIAQQSIAELTDEVLQLERQTVYAGAVLTILAFLLAVGVALASVRLLRPLRTLAEGARAVSRGEFSVEVPDDAPGEIGALASEFTAMARSLRERDQRLAEERRFHANIVASLEAGVMVVDGARRLVSANPAARALFGLEADAIGRAVARTELVAGLADEGSRRALESALDQVRAGGPPVGLAELPFGERLVTVSVSPLAEGQALVLATDVTSEVRTNRRLIQSERLAAVGKLAAQVAHEIRNPLSSIALNTELLEEEVGDKGEARAILSAVQREVERLTAITEEYLRYARLPRPRLRRGELNDVLRELCGFMNEELSAQGVALETDLSGELPPVRADERQLRQAFLNVMKNSQGAMGKGGRLAISTRPVSAGVEVRISDTGEGIAPEHLEQVFEPFFSTKEEGTGLGLAVTRQIVEEHGGSVRIESERGKGTTLTVTLPAADAEGASAPELEDPVAR
jgi:nitrogen fixation/metabolism regulation signal transduction histidine kinase